MITFDREPSTYQHWRLTFDGPVATLTLDVNEDAGIDEGYKLKLNSYDLSVDIELRDALDRIRFEHPEVGSVIVASGKERMFCAGANIYMLGKATHATKVNFCKFTNETRNGIEDSSERSGLKFLAAVNGTAAGGGYELALACDEIVLVDDRSSTVSFPEVPLLAVLPGTGGLTRLVDKRHVRRDLADVFCTTAEGFGGAKAKTWGLVDEVVPPRAFPEKVQERAAALAAKTDRPKDKQGVALTPLRRTLDETGIHYDHVDVAIDAEARTITITVSAPSLEEPIEIPAIEERAALWWPLAMARELDDAILHLRTNVRDAGIWILKTRGEMDAVLRVDGAMEKHAGHWFVRETINYIRRTFARLDVSSRSIYAVIDQGSAFAGTLFELALAADRSYMLTAEENAPQIALSVMNFGPYEMPNRMTRLATRFGSETAGVQKTLLTKLEAKLDAAAAMEAGLITFAPDELDWEDELRLAIEERASLSPDALTGMEASLRFAGPETVATKIFGRLSAWQNWIFIRPNAVGEQGALKLFGSGTKPRFSWERV
ncbi:MAG: benzoyl-CoA-dihydrodiol lyase [Acidobacteriota bacterium]|jgi:benzoyl-CoA-dihydrodiol lyase|nr:benzoyl-CoA-dihydrodiol lyase [Acidobacteriota bacterium]